jgi:nucleotide-binding universal stress UspA family protein
MPDRSRQNGAECRLATFAQHVLVPIDFSETSRGALAWAAALVKQCHASLHLLHVLEEIVGAEPLEWNLGARSEIEQAVERSAWDDLRLLLSDEDHVHLHVRMAVEWGSPSREIIRYATAHDVDLIAMGRHGRSGIKNLLIGSVAEKVMRSASCAVLSVNTPVVEQVTRHTHHQPFPAEP